MSETYTNNVGRSDYRLPTVSANDNGKILKVVEGEWKKAEGGGGSSLPEYGESDAGKVLKVAEGGESLEWGAAGGGGGGGAEPIIIESLAGATIPLTYNDLIGGKIPYLFVGSTDATCNIYAPSFCGLVDGAYGVVFYSAMASTSMATFTNSSADGNLTYFEGNGGQG